MSLSRPIIDGGRMNGPESVYVMQCLIVARSVPLCNPNTLHTLLIWATSTRPAAHRRRRRSFSVREGRDVLVCGVCVRCVCVCARARVCVRVVQDHTAIAGALVWGSRGGVEEERGLCGVSIAQ
jgi:hypothetical protein